MYAKNALIVDDSRTARAVLKNRLNEFDVVVESATDGNHALELLRHHTPDVIFLDHVMPGLDGFEVLERLKSNRSTRDIPVVMYTSQAAPMYTREAKSLGAVAVIPKEVSDEQLSTALDKAELYQLTAANEDYHGISLPEAANDAIALVEAGVDGRPEETRQYQQPTDVNDRSDHSDLASASIPPEVIEQVRTSEVSGFASGRWMLACAIAVLTVSQMLSMHKMQVQNVQLAELNSQVQQQALRLPELESQLRVQQHQLRSETSSQIEFLANILTAQIQQATIRDQQSPPSVASAEGDMAVDPYAGTDADPYTGMGADPYTGLDADTYSVMDADATTDTVAEIAATDVSG